MTSPSTVCAALSVVLDVEEVHVAREAAALRARLDEIAILYPQLFFTDMDIGRAYNVSACDDTFAFHEVMLYNGKDEQGRYSFVLPDGLFSSRFIDMWEEIGWFVHHGQEEAWKEKYAIPLDPAIMTATANGRLLMPEGIMPRMIFEAHDTWPEDDSDTDS